MTLDRRKLLNKRGRRKKRNTFKIAKEEGGFSYVRETDEDGMIVGQFRVPTKDMKTIDLWTHEFSERAIHDVLNPYRERGYISRYKEENRKIEQYNVPIAHAMVSHHTKSGVEKTALSPMEFEKWFWETGKEENFPVIEETRLRWTAVLRKMKGSKTKGDLRGPLRELIKIKEGSLGRLPPKHIGYMSRIIEKIEKKIRE